MGCASSQAKSSPEEDEELKKVRAMQDRGKRAGVAAESVDKETIKDYVKPNHPKDQAQKDKVLATLSKNDKMKVLFGHLEGDRLNDVVNAFYLKDIQIGENVIKQGDQGDCLYIIDTGTVDIFVNRPGQGFNAADKGAKVLTLGSGAVFGELALMYKAPRAATVTAVTQVKAFVLDAIDFKMLLAQSSQAQYAQYEGWLKEVELLKTLNQYELSKIADILESAQYKPGQDIITQGQSGDRFYILENGTAAAFISGDGGEKEVKKYERQGDYFGEIALLTAEPRKATVRATGSGCAAVSLKKADFEELMGPVSDILKTHADKYPQYAEFLRQ